MTNISDGFFVLLFGAFALGAVVGLVALGHALYRVRTQPLGPFARVAVWILIPAFAAVAVDPPLMPAARVPFGLLAAALAIALVLDARRPNADGSRATRRRIAAGVPLLLAIAVVAYRPVADWSRSRADAAHERERIARLASPAYRARVEREFAECTREESDGSQCAAYGFTYREQDDRETARRFLVAACDRGNEQACHYAQDDP